ncbi:hypothetical protein BH160DRAFT_0075 [Burkholderia sp. H160]|nr:hypothetical protein BH160DRAFT_0075 [Burkholderia sp. H160]
MKYRWSPRQLARTGVRAASAEHVKVSDLAQGVGECVTGYPVAIGVATPRDAQRKHLE